MVAGFSCWSSDKFMLMRQVQGQARNQLGLAFGSGSVTSIESHTRGCSTAGAVTQARPEMPGTLCPMSPEGKEGSHQLHHPKFDPKPKDPNPREGGFLTS